MKHSILIFLFPFFILSLSCNNSEVPFSDTYNEFDDLRKIELVLYTNIIENYNDNLGISEKLILSYYITKGDKKIVFIFETNSLNYTCNISSLAISLNRKPYKLDIVKRIEEPYKPVLEGSTVDLKRGHYLAILKINESLFDQISDADLIRFNVEYQENKYSHIFEISKQNINALKKYHVYIRENY